MTANIYLGDCMDGLTSGKKWDLAIVDPPYGINVANMDMGVGKSKRCSKAKNRKWQSKDWDTSTPDSFLFQSLFAASKNQVIWGGNYFELPISRYFAIWDKGEGVYGRDFAECEYAWVSNGGTRIFKQNPVQKDRIHPTQKPVALYKWLLKNYAKPGDTILDTHGGSMSIVLACIDMGFDIDCYEKDEDYYFASKKRILNHVQQLPLFGEPPTINFHF